MRLSTDEDRSEARAAATIAAAVQAGIAVFDTARAYGLGEDDLGHNERLLARTLRACGAEGGARIVTKGGMTRPGGGWLPDGRAKAIRADCEASLAALDGIPVDCYLLHAPDPRTPWRTSVRALGRLVDEGLVRRVGIANVNRDQLDEALELAPIAAVSVALGPYDDRALRGGVVERCAGAGVAVIAHAPARRPAPRPWARPQAGAGRDRRQSRADGGRGRRWRGCSPSRPSSCRSPAHAGPRRPAPRPGRPPPRLRRPNAASLPTRSGRSARRGRHGQPAAARR